MSKPTAVLFLCANTAADALGGLGRAFRNSFERLGHTFVEINFARPDAIDALNRTIKELPIEMVFTFIGMGVELPATTSEGKDINLWEGLRVPVISLYGDSPAYYFDRHVMPGRMFACLYGFPEHYSLRTRLPHIRGLLGTIPSIALDPVPKSEIDFSTKERGRILFLKNGNDPQELIVMWRHALPDSLFVMITDMASELVRDMEETLGTDIDGLVTAFFLDKGLDIEWHPTLRLFFLAQLDDYLRRVKSTMIAESLLDFPIEIHGDKWQHVNFNGRKATLVSGGDYAKSKKLIKNALALLDMSPNTGLAPHDRPLRAMGMYTLCLTNEQKYFNERFSNYQAFSFHFEKESLQSKIADVIAHPRRYVELGCDVAEVFRKDQDPDALARHLLDVASCLRLGSSQRMQGQQDYFAWPPEKLR